jgi:hypothetical protein
VAACATWRLLKMRINNFISWFFSCDFFVGIDLKWYGLLVKVQITMDLCQILQLNINNYENHYAPNLITMQSKSIVS